MKIIEIDMNNIKLGNEKPVRLRNANGTYVRTDPKIRFMKFVSVAKNGCWNWTGCKLLIKKAFYCQFYDGKRREWSHRVSYRMFNGEIPNNLTVDHQCNNTICVNPDHLKLMTLKENILRGNSVAAVNARKTHCIRGHELSGKNLVSHKSVRGRTCKICYYKSCRDSVLRHHEARKKYWREYNKKRINKCHRKGFKLSSDESKHED